MRPYVMKRWLVRSHGTQIALVLAGGLVALVLPRRLDATTGDGGLRELKLLVAWATWLATTLVVSFVQLWQASRRVRAARMAAARARRRSRTSATLVESPAGVPMSSASSRPAPAAVSSGEADAERVGPGDRYRILRELGRGGMGVVYLATDTVLHREVALKELPLHLGGRSDLAERFRLEGRVLARLAHPSIVQVYDLIEDGGQLWMALEYVPGGTLEGAMRCAGGALPWTEVVRIGEQVGEGLGYAHAQGVIHRDIKPANVLLSGAHPPLAKLTDFGLARLAESTEHTQPGSLLGSARYMSPEQVAGRPADARSDLYSLGVTFFEMLAGRVPFDGELAAVLVRHANEPPPDVRALAPDTPPALATLVASLLAKSPDERPQTAEHVVIALRALAAGGEEMREAA